MQATVVSVSSRFTLTVAVLALISAGALRGQTAPIGIPDDWTHHHVVFSDPGTASQAAVSGKLDQWKRIMSDPRYQIQQAKRAMMQRGAPAPAFDFATLVQQLSHPGLGATPISPRLRIQQSGKWSMLTGGLASQIGTVSGAASTATGQTIVIKGTLTLTATPTVASASSTFSGDPTSGDSLTIASGTLSITLSSAATGTGVCTASTPNRTGSFTRGSTTAAAANLVSLINSSNCGAFVGVGATNPTGAEVTITATTAGTAGNSISVKENSSGFDLFSTTATDLSGGLNSTQSGTDFETSTTASVEATNIADAINVTGNGSSVGVTAVANSPASGDVTVTATTAGTAGNSITLAETVGNFSWNGGATTLANGETPVYTPDIYPAKYNFSTGSTGTAAGNCDSAATPDYVVYPTGLTGTSANSQPDIVAYDNIYSNCSTATVPFPNPYWQYDTGGTVTTSPVLSLDGTQVAFVQANSTPSAQLVLLKWNKDSSVQTLTNESSGTAYNTCLAPCMYVITFTATKPNDGADTATVPTDTYSSPFYSYANDTLYVGDDNGYIHEFHPVFSGAPAEVTSTYPVVVSVAPLNSPVFDYASGLIEVGPAVYAAPDEDGSSAYFHHVNASTGATVANHVSMAEIGTAGDPIFIDAALVDSTAEEVYVFVNDDGGSPASAAVWQLAVDFPTNTTPVEAKIGQAGYASGDGIYAGAFDNYYFTHSSVGNLFVCGRASGSQDSELWKVSINGTTLTPTAIDTLTTATAQCSPVTEFLNGSTDYIFLSVAGSSETASPISCGSNSTGCLMSFNPSSSTGLAAGANTESKAEVAGGTSGLIIDNDSTTTGNAQIYFFPLGATSCGGDSTLAAGVGTGLCSFQLSQSALQ